MKKHKRERKELRAQVAALRQSVQVERNRAGRAESERADLGRKLYNLRTALFKVKTTRNAAGHPTIDRLKALAREAIDEAR